MALSSLLICGLSDLDYTFRMYSLRGNSYKFLLTYTSDTFVFRRWRKSLRPCFLPRLSKLLLLLLSPTIGNTRQVSISMDPRTDHRMDTMGNTAFASHLVVESLFSGARR